jgi:diguanylate cyclase (GGDEF)-like protein
MISGKLVVVTGHLVQAVCALAIALVLLGFHRHYRRKYLWHWAWSWWGFFLYLLGGAGALYLQPQVGAAAPLRLGLSILSMIGGYWQLGLLLSGTWELSSGREIPERRIRWLLAGLAGLALLVIFGSLSLPVPARLLVRVGGRALLAGLVFFVAAWGVLRSRSRSEGLGRWIVSGAFVVYGLEQVHYAVLSAIQFVDGRFFDYVMLLSLFDVVLQALMGIGMVIWLLDEERKQTLAAVARIEHLAYHDPLTGLANRLLFLEHLRLALARAVRYRRSVAVLFLDLDRFKIINDSLGHNAGDRLLQAVADRLRGRLRQSDTVARLGGDEFAILLPEIRDSRDVAMVAEKMRGLLRPPFLLEGREIVITVSLGISRFPEDAASPEELLKKADFAMYRAKERGRDGWQAYDPSMDAHAHDRLSLESDLRRAIARDELALYFQPIGDAHTRRIQGVEALLRWRHPERGLMQPGEFLWVTEPSDLSDQLDLWVLGTACRELQSWRAQGASLRVAVNLSARPFQDPHLVERVRQVLDESGLPPSCLELEITETLAMQHAEASLGVLRDLKDLGVRIVIDDFGNGYSSLSYLRNFPIDALKIDRAFVQELGELTGGAEIPSAIIALAHSLDIRVVAEGVENEGQWRVLAKLGCDEIQGYLLSPPLPAGECRALVLGVSRQA